MTITGKTLGALALGLAVAASASPSFAQRSEEGMSGARAKALHDCNAEAGKMTQSTSASIQLNMYRPCMAQHGMDHE